MLLVTNRELSPVTADAVSSAEHFSELAPFPPAGAKFGVRGDSERRGKNITLKLRLDDMTFTVLTDYEKTLSIHEPTGFSGFFHDD